MYPNVAALAHVFDLSEAVPTPWNEMHCSTGVAPKPNEDPALVRKTLLVMTTFVKALTSMGAHEVPPHGLLAPMLVEPQS